MNNETTFESKERKEGCRLKVLYNLEGKVGPVILILSDKIKIFLLALLMISDVRKMSTEFHHFGLKILAQIPSKTH